ncbi:MAG TPA: endonuclease III [Armatimonadota bacterium]
MSEKLTEKVRRVEAKLAERYGRPEWAGPGDPLDELMLTILSQNTSDVNRDKGFRQLKERFPTWNQTAAADVGELEAAIAPAGLSKQKAPRMLAVLHDIERQFGELSLGELENWPSDRVKAFLTSYPGVGPKTAACVLMFAMGRPVMPVDTHVYRIAGRLGLLPPKASYEEAHDSLERITPPELVYPFHIEMIRHGRALCRPTNPKCPDCPVRDDCDYYNGRR